MREPLEDIAERWVRLADDPNRTAPELLEAVLDTLDAYHDVEMYALRDALVDALDNV